MKLAVFTVMIPDLTPEEAVLELKARGYDGVEWRVSQTAEHLREEPPSFWRNNLCTFVPTEAEAQRAKNLSQEAGLATPNIGTYIGLGELDKVRDAIGFAKVLGSPHFRVGFGNFSGNYARHFADARAFLQEVIELAKPEGLKPLVEIHHRTIVPSASLTHKLVSHFSSDEVGVIHDAGNMVHEGFEDYRMGLEILGEYLSAVHIKNAAYDTTEPVWRCHWSPLREGVVDFHALFAALKERQYDGWLAVEDFSQALPSREALRDNAQFIRAAWERA